MKKQFVRNHLRFYQLVFPVIFFLFQTGICDAQFGLHVYPQDTFISFPNNLTFHAQVAGGYNNPIVVTNFFDDRFSDPIPIGFSFNFFGNNYSSCLIGSNGVISFDISQAGGYCPWPIGSPIPSNGSSLANSVMMPWQDLVPSGFPPTTSEGIISYKTYGVTPNKFFVINFDDVPMYNVNTERFCGNVVFYQTSNVIDCYIARKDTNPNWNGSAAIEGIENGSGTIAFSIPGRNFPSIWTCSNDAWRFTPDSVNHYSVSQIPYTSSVNYLGSTITWLDYTGNHLGNGTTYHASFNFDDSLICRYGFCGDYEYDTIHVNSFPSSVYSIIAKSFSIFPNPTHDNVAISFSENGNHDLLIRNIFGQQVLKIKTSEKSCIVPLGNLSAGVYFVEVSNEMTVETVKLIVQ